MTRGSELLLSLVVGGTLLLVGLFLFVLGPLGWAVAAVIGLAVLATSSVGDGDGTPERTNCGACGAPNDPDRSSCDHCGESL